MPPVAPCPPTATRRPWCGGAAHPALGAEDEAVRFVSESAGDPQHLRRSTVRAPRSPRPVPRRHRFLCSSSRRQVDMTEPRVGSVPPTAAHFVPPADPVHRATGRGADTRSSRSSRDGVSIAASNSFIRCARARRRRHRARRLMTPGSNARRDRETDSSPRQPSDAMIHGRTRSGSVRRATGEWSLVPGPPTEPRERCVIRSILARFARPAASPGRHPPFAGTFPLHREWSITRIADRVRIPGCDTANAATDGPFPGAPVPDCHGYLPDPPKETPGSTGDDRREIARPASRCGESGSVIPGRRNW